VAVNSARPNPQPWRSNGVIPSTQLSALARLLDDERVRGRFVFVLTHYAPRLEGGRRDTRLHGLNNAEAFLAACSGLERGAILCGHSHHAYQVRVAGVRPPIYCAGSATMEGRESFWVYDFDGTEPTATCGRWDGTAYLLEPSSEVGLL
jgi:hypothetical protein